MRWFTAVGYVALLALVSCEPEAVAPNPLRNANGGVQILPDAVLASERMTPDATQPAPEDKPNLITVVSQSQEDHQLILRAIRAAGMVPLLQSKGPWTLLAPTDEAFSKFPPGLFARVCMPEHLPELKELLQYHLLKGAISPDDMLHTSGTVTTLAAAPVTIQGTDGKIMINDANVVRSNTTASNGVVYWLDNVLLRP